MNSLAITGKFRSYGKRNFGGRHKVLPSKQKKTDLRIASTEKFSSMEITKQTGLNDCRKTILNTIRRAGNLQYSAKLIKPPLLP